MTKTRIFSERLENLSCSSATVPPEEFVNLAVAAEAEAEATSNPELYHLATVAWYENPATSPKRSQKVRELGAKALALNPTHQFAQQYQAYICFDEQSYEEAIEYLRSLDDSFFESLEQHWRVFKNRELLLVAHLETSQACDQPMFLQLLADYEEFSDSGGPPVPY